MNKFYLIFLIGLFVSACSKDICKDVDRGVYVWEFLFLDGQARLA